MARGSPLQLQDNAELIFFVVLFGWSVNESEPRGSARQ